VRLSHFLTQCFSESVVNAHVREKSPAAISPEMLDFIAPKPEISFKLSVIFRFFEPSCFGGNVEKRETNLRPELISLFDIHTSQHSTKSANFISEAGGADPKVAKILKTALA
jgi:hypothetical protein